MFPSFEITDEVNGLGYLTLSDNPIVRSVEVPILSCVLDIDNKGELVGIEILSISKFISIHFSIQNLISQELLSILRIQ